MRLWSLHPKYLDTKWLLASWREWLLARNVLLWNTKWYKNHPQLNRFKTSINPLDSIDAFLYQIYLEAKSRWYNFSGDKIKYIDKHKIIKVTSWQVNYEFKHLLNKLEKRDLERFEKFMWINDIEVNPIFEIVLWEIEDWEIVN